MFVVGGKVHFIYSLVFLWLMLCCACNTWKNSDFTYLNVIWASINGIKKKIRFALLLERIGDTRVLLQRFTCSTLLMNGSRDLLRVTCICTQFNAVTNSKQITQCLVSINTYFYSVKELSEGEVYGVRMCRHIAVWLDNNDPANQGVLSQIISNYLWTFATSLSSESFLLWFPFESVGNISLFLRRTNGRG